MRSSRADGEALPGEFGPDATVEVDPHRVGPDFVSVGAGRWDGEHRPSWVNLDRVIRVIRVHEGGMRREASALPREPFERVTDRRPVLPSPTMPPARSRRLRSQERTSPRPGSSAPP